MYHLSNKKCANIQNLFLVIHFFCKPDCQCQILFSRPKLPKSRRELRNQCNYFPWTDFHNRNPPVKLPDLRLNPEKSGNWKMIIVGTVQAYYTLHVYLHGFLGFWVLFNLLTSVAKWWQNMTTQKIFFHNKVNFFKWCENPKKFWVYNRP